MKNFYRRSLVPGAGLLFLLVLAGRDTVDAQAVAVKKLPVGKNVSLEIEGTKRRVVINAFVCLRQGQMEQLLTRKRTKEHEAPLAADLDARDVHLALTLAKAEPGQVERFLPKFEPPMGSPIKITLEYQQDGKTVRVPGQQWIRNIKTKKPLDTDWVFAGSKLFPGQNPNDPPFYAANDGDVICISNFDTALLDVPFPSSKDNDALSFEANTALIPPVETPVTVILEPQPFKKKG